MKKKQKKQDLSRTNQQSSLCSRVSPHLCTLGLFFIIAWLWASWWMGDIGRIARERSFFSTDPTLMHFLSQQAFGWLWIIGRALLTFFRWPWFGGFLVAIMLTISSWLFGYITHLNARWRWIQFLPSIIWMVWVAWSGMELYFQHESGRALGLLTLGLTILIVAALTTHVLFRRSLVSKDSLSKDGLCWKKWMQPAFVLILAVIPFETTTLRHPYLRPLTHMEVQMLNQDWQGMTETALQHATLSYRPLAAYYAIALTRTGRLADDLFQIRLDYDSLLVCGRNGKPDIGTTYYQTDCNYHAGLLRVAEHNAMELLTMDGPSLYSLKHLSRLALLHGDYNLARKYLDLIALSPFESDFVGKYTEMLPPNPSEELIAADSEFAAVRMAEPVSDCFESQFLQPTFLGYSAVLTEGRSMQVLQQSLMANLYSKRMPDFLLRCEPLVGQTLPRSIAEGLITQVHKNPEILRAFPNLQMDAQRYSYFIQGIQPYIKDRQGYARQLFDQYQGYYPYYYYFGNLKSTRKKDDKESPSSAGVN